MNKDNSNGLKILGVAGLVMISGVIGGLIALEINKATSVDGTNVSKNETVTTYNIETVESPVVAIAQKLSPSVVGVKVSYTSQNLWGITQAEGEGSGIVYSTDGYIVTNYHVIESAVKSSSAKIYVLLADDETEREATIVGYDELTDLAVIKIEENNLTAAEFGNSDEIKVGELAVAIGNPLGQEFAGTVTGGYISGLNRSITVDNTVYNLIQTDAAINSGNSGGPLVDSKGRVIGVNTAKISATGVEGIGFAIPVNDVLPIVEELIQNKKINRPYIGIGGITLSSALAYRNNLVEGVYIQEITENSPAQKAGIKIGDVVCEVGDQKVSSISDINAIKNKLNIGDTLKLKIYRAKEYITVDVVLAATNDFN